MKRGLIALSLLLVLLLLVSCQQTLKSPSNVEAALKAVKTGSEGVTFSFLPNFPPSTTYDENELVSIVEIRNKGNYNLEAQDCFVQITGFDPNIIGGGYYSPRSCAETLGTLEGKTIYNLEGDFNQLEFRSTNVRLPEGTFSYDPNLKLTACYNYHTQASPLVCVDPSPFQISNSQKTCLPQDVGMGGGQGGPVGVTYVGVDMVGHRAIFDINVKNLGSGEVLSPNSDIRTCGQGSLTYQDFDRVAYSVKLSGGSIIDCKPRDGIVRLNNGQGKIICSFNIPGTFSYETPLLIDLDYGYIDSTQKPIKIIRTPQ